MRGRVTIGFHFSGRVRQFKLSYSFEANVDTLNKRLSLMLESTEEKHCHSPGKNAFLFNG